MDVVVVMARAKDHRLSVEQGMAVDDCEVGGSARSEACALSGVHWAGCAIMYKDVYGAVVRIPKNAGPLCRYVHLADGLAGA